MAYARTFLLVALAWQADAVAAPALDRIEPPAGKQGSEIEITIFGTELDEPQELFFEDGRITATAIATKKENVVKATLSIPVDCPLGPHRMRVRTAEGLSELRVFRVHGTEQAAEKEPNNEAAAAMPVTRGTAIWGTLDNEDVDVFAIHLAAGERIAAVVEAVALEQQMLDPHLELVDADGFTIAACDDHPLLAQDAALAATVEEDGDYFLRIRETAYGGGNGLYLLHVGDFPVPHVAWPPGGALGGPLGVEWLGDPSGPFEGQAALVGPGIDGVCRVRPSRDGTLSPVAVPFRATAAPIVIETDAGKEPEKAIKATAPCAIAGRMDASDDVDWFRVEAPRGSKWKVTGWGRRLGSPVDLVVNVHRDDAQRQRITGNDDTGGPDSMVQVTVPDEEAFLLRVNDFQRRGGGEFVYWIDVEPLAPSVVVSVPPAQTKTQQRLVVAVPRGNRMALFFNATRTECSAPVTPDFTGLPAGVTALASAFEQPATGGLVVFEAAPDAGVGTTMTAVRVLRGDGDAPAAVGGLLQGTEMVYGDPNREPYRIALGDRLAVAVVEEAPVVLELEPPAVPIVRRGLLDLKVKVHRAEGFTGKIQLELPFKPPGIAASVVDVKEGEVEVRFPISAAADAPVKEWQIAVAASLVPEAATKKEERKARRAGRGSWISTRPVPLAVIEPMVDLTAEKAQVEQGSQTTLVFKTSKPAAFEGRAKVTLLGLPAKAEAPVLELESGKESIEFPVTVAADAPAGKHDNIFCRIEVPKGDAWVIHQTAATSLRIDKPLPPEKGKEGGS
ncbi:MAG: hypothetical protein ACKOYJ_00955 [Planctomycetia bacterium]